MKKRAPYARAVRNDEGDAWWARLGRDYISDAAGKRLEFKSAFLAKDAAKRLQAERAASIATAVSNSS